MPLDRRERDKRLVTAKPSKWVLGAVVDVPPGLGRRSQCPKRYGPGGLNSENNVPYFRNFRAAQTIHQEVLIHRKFAPISARRARQHQKSCSMLLLCSMRNTIDNVWRHDILAT